MTATIHRDITQGSDAWREARLGIVTASVAAKLVTPTLKVAANETSRGITTALVAERITGHMDEGYIGGDMWRGIEDEPRARDTYAEHHAPVEEVGLIVRDFDGYRIGYSPDGLVGDDGLIEIKSRLQKLHLATILDDTVPREYMAQLQTGLLVSGREWIDFISYCGGMPLWVRRVWPDPAWFDAILTAVEQLEANAADITARYHAAVKGLPMTERANYDAEIEF